VSKTIAAMAILALVGKTGLNTDVKEGLGEELWNVIDPNNLTQDGLFPVTIKGLLSHTAGITLGSEEQSGFDGYSSEEKLPTLEEIIRGHSEDNPHVNSGPIRVTTQPDPKGRGRYQGGGPTLLQKWVENVAGDFATLVEKKVFDPLGMHHTTYSPKNIPVSSGYDDHGKSIPGDYRIYPELAAAGAWTTPKDLAKLVIEIQKAYHGKGKILDQETAQEMLQEKRGLGVAVPPVNGARYFFHQGENRGFRCMIIGNTDGKGAVIMTNSDNGEALRDELIARIAEVYDWKKADQVEEIKPLMDSSELININRDNWAAKSEANYFFKPNPNEEVAFRIYKEPGKLYGQFTVTKNGTQEADSPFEIFPITNTRGCFRTSKTSPYRPIDLILDQKRHVIGVELYGKNHLRVGD
jgi:hypothetical protein